MASIKVHGGDFVAGHSGTFKSGALTLPTLGVGPADFLVRLMYLRPGKGSSFQERISLSEVMRVEAVNKEMKHRTVAAVTRGIAGGMIAGPIGSIVGFTTTNHTSDVTFEAEFEGGRRLLATTDTDTYTKLLAAAFDYKPPSARPVANHESEDHGGPRPGIVFGIVGTLLVTGGMINGVPLAWGIAVGALVLIVGCTIMKFWSNEISVANIPRATRAMFATWFRRTSP
jgi:hypothetical protein